MNIAVIGLGSMGKRRIRLIQNIFPNFIIYGVDIERSRMEQVEREFKVACYSKLDEIINIIPLDCAFVCTSPLSHALIIRECLSAGLHVFSEINLVDDGYEDNIKLAEKTNRILFLSSTLLFRKEILFIIDKVQHCTENVNYIYHVGQFLADWHPWESYQDYFVGNKRTNGCRELFAIELPWIIKSFGDIDKMHVLASKNSTLQIDYNDNYLVQMEHKNGNKGLLAVDVISREAVRNLEVYGESIYLEWKGKPNTLFLNNSKGLKAVTLYNEIDKLEGYSNIIIENQYSDEIKTFFMEIEGKSIPKYSFREDKEILRLIDEIEYE